MCACVGFQWLDLRKVAHVGATNLFSGGAPSKPMSFRMRHKWLGTHSFHPFQAQAGQSLLMFEDGARD